INETENILFLDFNDETALEKAFKENEIAAVIIEGIQGVGGIRIPTTQFLQKIESLCEKHQAVFIADEIQSGYGLTGKFFAHQFADVQPDLITMAKGMGNGFPVAGVLISPKIQPKKGMLGTTFGGNYLACAASLAVLEVMKEESLIENAQKKGDYLVDQLQNILHIAELENLGLMIGIELDRPCAEIRNNLLTKHHILTVNSSDKNTLRVLPALNVGTKEIDQFIQALKSEINA